MKKCWLAFVFGAALAGGGTWAAAQYHRPTPFEEGLLLRYQLDESADALGEDSVELVRRLLESRLRLDAPSERIGKFPPGYVGDGLQVVLDGDSTEIRSYGRRLFLVPLESHRVLLHSPEDLSCDVITSTSSKVLRVFVVRPDGVDYLNIEDVSGISIRRQRRELVPTD